MPPHWWLPLKSSSCKDRRRELGDALGQANVKKVWQNKRKTRCYAVVCAEESAIPSDMLDGNPIKVIADASEQIEDPT